MATSRRGGGGGGLDNETMAGVNYRFAVLTEKEIFQTQNNAIPNNTKKARKLGMKVFRGKQCFNIQFANTSSALKAFLNPDRQATLMPLSLNNNCPSTAPFQSPIQVSSTCFKALII